MPIKAIVSGVEKDIKRVPMKGQNLFDGAYQKAIIGGNSGNVYSTNSSGRTAVIPCSPNTTYTVKKHGSSNRFMISESNKLPVSGDAVDIIYNASSAISYTFTTSGVAKYLLVYVSTSSEQAEPPLMLNLGSTPLPYEPYGYQEGWEVLDNQNRLIWGREETLTGTGSISFKGAGIPLKSVDIFGNTQQSGTPSPDNIIMPEFCGVRTGNLFPLDATKLHVGRIENDGTIDYEIGTITVGTNSVTYQANAIWRGFYTDYIRANENEKLTFSPNDSSSIAWSCSCYDENDNFLGKAPAQSTASIKTFTTLAGTKKVRISVTSSFAEYTITNPMLNAGDTAIPYEPYGWAEKITCAGQTVPVYLGQTQTTRKVKKLVLTGNEFWQKSNSYKGSFYAQLITDYLQLSYDAYCTHAVHVPTLSQYSKGKMAFNGGVVGNCNLWFEQFDENTTVADFKAYLAAQYAAGTPVTVWYVLATPEIGIVNEPLCKIGDYTDELNSAIPIPTVKGANVLTVDTTLPPSSMSITGHITSAS